jgi:hypothetical protein
MRNVILGVQAPRVALSDGKRAAQREIALGVARVENGKIEA